MLKNLAPDILQLGKRQIVRRPHGRYAVWSRGRGPLVILLHGWPVSSYHWRFLVPALDSAGFECVSIDLKGLGESVTNDFRFEKEVLARELLEIVSGIRPKTKRFAVIGHDWGGSIAIAMAALAPGRVSHLIIEDEIPPGIPAPLRGKSLNHYSTWHGGFHRVPGLPEKLIHGRENHYLNYFLDLRFNRKSLNKRDRKLYLDCYRSSKKTGTTLAYYRSFQEDSRFFGALMKQKIEIPVLALWGKYGMGPAVGDSLDQICSRATGIEMNKSGHYPAEEEPKKFQAAVLRYLRS